MQLSIAELTAARDALRQCENTVAALRGIFLVGGFTEAAQRANDIGGRIVDLIAAIDKVIGGAKP